MGSTASKPAQTVSRKFPSRPNGTIPPTQRPAAPRPQRPQQTPKASFAKDDAMRADDIDPDLMANSAFSQRLQKMGIATPNPTFSNSSIANPGSRESDPSPLEPSYPSLSGNTTLNALESRQRLQNQAEKQFENLAGGREFADAGTIRQALAMRERGVAAANIEKRLRLRSGVVARLGAQGVVAPL